MKLNHPINEFNCDLLVGNFLSKVQLLNYGVILITGCMSTQEP